MPSRRRRRRIALLLAAGAALAACAQRAGGATDDAAPSTVALAPLTPRSEPPGETEVTTAATTQTMPTMPTTPVSTPAAAPPGTTTGTTSTTAATRTPEVRTITMAFSGDTLAHSPLWAQARRNAGGEGFDFRPMLAELRPIVEPVDLAVCHLETPIAPEGEELSTAPIYGVPAEVVDAIAAAGYDRCSTASNHTADRGTAGIDRTVDVLESRGLGESGMARTPAEIEPHVVEVAGIRLTHLSYTFSYNGLSLPAGEEWRSALIDPARIIADARRARELGAEVVVVSLHWGVEGASTPTAGQRAIAAEIVAPGDIDLVVGHHAHVVQPIEQVGGTWVMFGLGNILSNLPTSARWPAASQDGAVVVVDVTVAPDGQVAVGRPVVHPTWVDRDRGWVVRPVLEELADPTTPDGLRGQLTASLERTRAVLGDFLAPIGPAPDG